eukprot:SAG22_NODE_1417_length_4469_cov_2.981465_5_plen_75_part_00
MLLAGPQKSLAANTRSALSAAVAAVDELVLDALRPLLRPRHRASGLGGLAGRTDCMLARYGTGGPRYVRHIDNT